MFCVALPNAALWSSAQSSDLGSLLRVRASWRHLDTSLSAPAHAQQMALKPRVSGREIMRLQAAGRWREPPVSLRERLRVHECGGLQDATHPELQLAHSRDRDTLSARTHQTSSPRQPCRSTAPRPARALSTTPASTQLHTNSSRQLHFGAAGRGAFELLTCDLTERHPCSMAQHPLHPGSVHHPQV